MKGAKNRSGQAHDLGARIALVLVGAIAFLPILGNGLLNWDDPVYITDSPALHGPQPLAAIWFGHGTPQYYPLSWTMLWLEHTGWGDAAAGYHAVSLALHLACGLILLGILRRFASVAPAAAGAALFLVHPIQVATVAWAAEQKTLLGALLVLLSLRWWIGAEGPRSRAASVASYLLSLLGKTSVLAVPLAFPLVRALRPGSRRATCWWVAAFAIPAVAAAFVTAIREDSPFREEGYTFLDRVFLAARGFWFYVGKTVWPARLSALYPKWERTGPVPEAWIALSATLVLAAAMVFLHRRGRHGVVAGIALFALPLGPASGLVRFGYMDKSFVGDHLLYLSLAGPALLAALGLERLRVRTSATGSSVGMGRAAIAGTVAVITILSVMTGVRTGKYRDTRTFWEGILASNPGSEIAHNNLGVALLDAGERPAAAEHFREASRLRPSYYEARINQATVLSALGDTPGARAQLREALRIIPGDRVASERLQALGSGEGDSLAALERRLRAGLSADPARIDRVLALAQFLRERGRAVEAIPLLQDATRRDPGDAGARFELGNAYGFSGQLALAERAYREVVRSRPDFVDGHHNLGVVLRGQGKFEEAVRELSEALRLSPGDADTERNLELARRRVP